MDGSMSRGISTIIFDLGGVLVDWDPRYLYRDVFRDNDAMERYLTEVCTPEWIREMDAGKSFQQAVSERVERFPDHAHALGLWLEEWDKTLRGSLDDSVFLLEFLAKKKHRLVALTNWSAETFPVARRRFAFLSYFEDILVSGEHGLVKPSEEIFQLARERWRIEPSHSLFIDDSVANIKTASRLGFQCIHFVGAESLARSLRQLALLP
jgi:2-haloacid dehalogenase